MIIPKRYNEIIAQVLDRYESVYQPVTMDEVEARPWMKSVPYEVTCVASLLAAYRSSSRQDVQMLRIASVYLYRYESVCKPYRFVIVSPSTARSITPTEEITSIRYWITYRIYNGQKVILAHESEMEEIKKLKGGKE